MNLHERIGQLDEMVRHEVQQHRVTIALLGRIQRGEVAIADVTMIDNGWELNQPEKEQDELRRETHGVGNDDS